MKRNNTRKINLTDKELEKIIRDAMQSYIEVQTDEENNGRIEDDIPDISDYVASVNYGNDDYVKRNLPEINEGLIMTHDINRAKNIICRKFNLLPQQFSISPRNFDGTIVSLAVIILQKGTSQSTIGEIKHYMQTLGYFECVPQNFVKGKIILIFEPHFSTNISNEIRNKYKILYHATPTIYVDKILKSGLIPRNKNTLFFYPSRVYCMRGNNLSDEQISILKNIQAQRGATTHHDNNEYTILSIDVSKLPTTIKFYADPMAPHAIFTHDNIPPQAISTQDKLKESQLRRIIRETIKRVLSL